MKQYILVNFLIYSILISSCTSSQQQTPSVSTITPLRASTSPEKSEQIPNPELTPSRTSFSKSTPSPSPISTDDIPSIPAEKWEISPATIKDVNLLYESMPSLPGSINHIDWSPDGTMLAVAGKQGLILVNGTDLSNFFTLKMEQTYYHLAFSPDGGLLAAARYPQIVDIWDVDTKELIISLENSGDKFYFSPSGKELAIVLDVFEDNDSVGAAKTYVKLFDLNSWKQTITLTTKTDIPYWTMQFPETIGVFFSQDGLKVQAVNILGDVRMWNSKTGALLNSSINTNTRERLENGTCLSSASMASEFTLSCMISYLDPPCNEDVPGCNPVGKLRYDIGIWDTNQLNRNRSFIIYDPPGYFISTYYEPKSKKLILNENDQIFILDLTQNIKQIKTRDEFDEKTSFIKLENCINCPYGLMDMTVRDNESLLALAKSGHIEIWDLTENILTHSLSNDISYPTTFDIGSENVPPTLVIGYSDGKIQKIDGSTGKETFEFLSGAESIRELLLSPNGEFLYSIDNNYTLKKWNLKSQDSEAGYPIELAKPQIISNSDNGLIAYIIYDPSIGKNQLVLADLKTNKVLRRIPTTAIEITFSQDGDFIATMDQTISLWDTNSGSLLRDFSILSPSYEKTFALSPDASFIGVAQDQIFKVWDVNSNATFQHEAVDGDATNVSFSPTGCLVAFGASNGWIYIMDLASKEIISSWQAHGSEIQELQFSQDGRLLISQSNLGTIRIWGQSGVLSLPVGNPATISCHNALPPQTSTPVTPTATFTPVTPTSTATLVTFYRTLILTEPLMQGTDILQMQQRLYTLGYTEVGYPDGIFGKKTDQAVRNFQEKNGLVVDGMVGPITWNHLFSEQAMRN